MMTLEMAADMVIALREAGHNEMAIELFCHFDDHFRLSVNSDGSPNGDRITNFAQLCKYAVASDVRRV